MSNWASRSACGAAVAKSALAVLVLCAVSMTCFALATRAGDQFNVAKLGEPYRIHMEQVPALNLLAGIYAWLRLRKEPWRCETFCHTWAEKGKEVE